MRLFPYKEFEELKSINAEMFDKVSIIQRIGPTLEDIFENYLKLSDKPFDINKYKELIKRQEELFPEVSCLVDSDQGEFLKQQFQNMKDKMKEIESELQNSGETDKE